MRSGVLCLLSHSQASRASCIFAARPTFSCRCLLRRASRFRRRSSLFGIGFSAGLSISVSRATILLELTAASGANGRRALYSECFLFSSAGFPRVRAAKLTSSFLLFVEVLFSAIPDLSSAGDCSGRAVRILARPVPLGALKTSKYCIYKKYYIYCLYFGGSAVL